MRADSYGGGMECGDIDWGCYMKRAEYIAKGGAEEMAKAMTFMIIRAFGGGCEELREGSKILKPIIAEWLEEDIDETHT